VNFTGLTRIEVHGQASIVTDSVARRLPPSELYVMLARFAQTEPEKSADVLGGVEYLYPASPNGNRAVLTDLVRRR
jgi:hypothetical protein